MLLKYDLMVYLPLVVSLLIGFGLGVGLFDALIIALAVVGSIVYGTLLIVYTWARLFKKEELLKELE
jgi:hypothetical protein